VSKTVLVVEDHADNLLIVATILRHYGYDVLTAEDGEVAISVAARELPDVVLLDISIPKIDGWDVARTLKQDSSTADIPLIAFTAHVYDADRARATDEGFVGFLTKPVEPTRIVQEISRLIGSP
jgi:two-component system, cell cycle response regulator DivK